VSLSSAAYQALRREMRDLWRSINAPCWLCQQAIDYDAEANTPDALELDHVKPRKTHPWLLLDRGNCRPSHHRCNRVKGAGGAPVSIGEPTEDW